jgi:ferrous iron transport protein B
MEDLLRAIEEVATGKYKCKPHKIKSQPEKLGHAIRILSTKLADAFPGLPNVNWIALRLLEGDNSIIEAVRSGEIGNLFEENSIVQH